MKKTNKTTFWNATNEKYFFWLLPYHFKTIGLLVASMALMAFVGINHVYTGIPRIALLNEMLYQIMVLAMLSWSFSKDREEDERIANLRFRSYGFAMGLLVLLFLLQPLIELVIEFLFTNDDYVPPLYNLKFYIFLIGFFVLQSVYFYKFKKDL